MNSSNLSHSAEKSDSLTTTDQATAVSLSISYGIVLIVAVVGNSLVINYARTNNRMKSNVFNLFLISMAAADIIDVLFVVPLHWIFFYYNNLWIGGGFGKISCKLIYFLVEVSIFASVLTLVAITMDRYFAICHINHAPLSRVKTRLIVVGIWIGSCLLSSIQLYKFKLIDYNGRSYCVSSWNQPNPGKREIMVQYEMTIKFAVSYGIPLLLMIVMYALVIRELRRRLLSLAVEENQELQKHIAHQNRPLVEMFITLVIIFAVCWFPVHVNHMLIAFDLDAYRRLPAALPLVFYLLAHANAAINPLLYFVFISGFRKELKKKTKRLWRFVTTLTDLSSLSKQRKQSHSDYQFQNNNRTPGQSPEPNSSTPEPFLKTLNIDTAGSTNRGLSMDIEFYVTGTLYDQPDSSPTLSLNRD